MSSGSSEQLTSCQGASKDYFWSSNLNWVEVFAAWHHWAGLGPVLGGGAASPGIYFTDEVLSSTAQSLTTNNNSPRRGQRASYWSRAGLPRCDWSSRRTSARRRHFRPGRWEARADAAVTAGTPAAGVALLHTHAEYNDQINIYSYLGLRMEGSLFPRWKMKWDVCITMLHSKNKKTTRSARSDRTLYNSQCPSASVWHCSKVSQEPGAASSLQSSHLLQFGGFILQQSARGRPLGRAPRHWLL